MVNLCNDGRRRLESSCLVPRRLSFDVRANEGEKETTGFALSFAHRLYPSHGPLRFITSHSRCALASAMRKRSAWGGGWESSILDFQNGFFGFFHLRLNTGIDPTTTIRRFIDSIRAEKFHLSLENMWKWNKTLILKYLYCLRNFGTARCFSGDII